MERPSISEHFAAEALQQAFEQGFKQGAREHALKDILDRLSQLHRATILTETLDDFAQVLTENSN